jgi:uncharacterized protein
MCSKKPKQLRQQLKQVFPGWVSQGYGWRLAGLSCGLWVLISVSMMVSMTAKPADRSGQPTQPPGVQSPKPSALPSAIPTSTPALFPALPLRAQQLPLTAYTVINSSRIELEVAQTPAQQEIGLMFRTSIANNRGMLFPFNPARPVGFWMKNCLMALDMVFIRSERVIDIRANVPPCRQDPCPSYGPKAPVDHVLELGAGRAASLGLQIGDPITIRPLTSLR